MEKQESFNICESADKAFLIESSNNFKSRYDVSEYKLYPDSFVFRTGGKFV